MDTSKFLGKFRDATREHLARMETLLLQLELDPTRSEDVKDLLREIHTLKGESRMMGYGDLADLAHAIEGLLKQLEAERFRALPDCSDALFGAFDAVARLLGEKCGEGSAGVDVATVTASLRGGPAGPSAAERPGTAVPAVSAPGAAGADSPEESLSFGDDPELAAGGEEAEGFLDTPAPDAEAAARAMREAFGTPEPPPAQPSPAPPAVEADSGSAARPRPATPAAAGVSRFLGQFRDATREHLARMSTLVLELEIDPSNGERVKDLLREVHTLKGESRMMGFGDMADIAHGIEDVLKAHEATGFAALAEASDALLGAFDGLERMLAGHVGEPAGAVDQGSIATALAGARASSASATPPVGAGQQALASQALPAPETRPAPAAEAPPATLPPPPPVAALGVLGTSKFLGKFRDATREHVERLNALVLQLEADPSNAADIKELMREVHTLKGESRMMGFGDMAELAHAVEDRLKALETAQFAGLSESSDLLFEAFDAITRLLGEKLGEAGSAVDTAQLAARLRASPAAALPAAAASPRAAVAAAAPEAALAPLAPEAALAPLAPEAALAPLAPEAPRAAPASPRAPIDPLLAESFAAVLAAHVAEARVALPAAGTGQVAALARVLANLGADADLAGFAGLHRFARAAAEAVSGGVCHEPAGREALAAAFDELPAACLTEALGEPVDELVARLALALGSRPMPASSLPTTGAAPPTAPAAPPRVAAALPLPATVAPAPTPAPSPVPAPVLAPVPAPTPRTRPAAPPSPVPVAVPGGSGAPPARSADALPVPTRPGVVAPRPEETVRVALAKLEDLGNLTGDIHLNHSRSEERQRRLRTLLDVTSRQARALAGLREALARRGGGLAADPAVREAWEGLQDVARQVRTGVRDALRRDHDENLRSGHSVVELRERVRALQMVPAGTLFDMYPRMVRDIGKSLGKQVRLVVQGADAELDRRILDEIRDPMVHLIRNSIDHGIEEPDVRVAARKNPQGTVTLSARTEGDHVVIEVADDGGGIDPRHIRDVAVRRGVLTREEADALDDEGALQLVFAAGFSSKEAVSDLSGRGVGLDVVRDRVERLEGRISLTAEPGRGTRMALRLPLTLALARVILLRAGGLTVAVPCALVEEVLSLPEADVRRVETYEAMEWQGRSLPLVSLANVLERPANPKPDGVRRVVILAFEGHVVGFVVDAFVGEREVVVKRLDAFLGRVRNVAGATLLASGDIVAVLHVPQLIASTMGVSPVRLQARVRLPEEFDAPRGHARRLLVVDDSIIVRDMMKGVLDAAGFDVTLAVDGLDGLEKQLAGSFDLVITDVEMPRMDGFELTRSLKQNEKQARVPIIIVTTLDSPEARERGLRVGASAYLVKNLLDMSQLVSTIERLVA